MMSVDNEKKNETEMSTETLQRVADALSETAACVMFLGFLGMIASILTVALAAVALLAGFTDLDRGGIGIIVAGFAFGAAAVIWFYPSKKLLAYGKSIAEFRQHPGLYGLRRTILEQAAFWRFATIALVAVTIACMLAFFVRLPSS